VFLEPGVGDLPFDSGTDVVSPVRRLNIIEQAVHLHRLLRRNRDRVIVSNTLRAAVMVVAVKPRGQDHVVILHDGISAGSLSLLRRLLTAAVFSLGVRDILPNSAWTAATVPSRYRHLVRRPVYSPSGIRGTSPEVERVESPRLRLLSLSRLVEWKGIHVILEALQLLGPEIGSGQIELTIAGDNVMGPSSYRDALRVAAESSRFSVTFLPHQTDVAPLLESHDVLVHASIRPEPFGQVVVQGLAFGLAVLASADGGPAEIIEDGVSGLLHEPGDAAALAASIRRLFTAPQTLPTLGAAGRLRALDFTDARCAQLLDSSLVGTETIPEEDRTR
jgi:glycosyltransferase involved in cell wall biosynthesis